MLCVNFQDHLHGPESVLADMIPLFLLLLELTSHAAYSQLTLHVLATFKTSPSPWTKLPQLSISHKHVEGSEQEIFSSFLTPPAQDVAAAIFHSSVLTQKH